MVESVLVSGLVCSVRGSEKTVVLVCENSRDVTNRSEKPPRALRAWLREAAITIRGVTPQRPRLVLEVFVATLGHDSERSDL